MNLTVALLLPPDDGGVQGAGLLAGRHDGRLLHREQPAVPRAAGVDEDGALRSACRRRLRRLPGGGRLRPVGEAAAAAHALRGASCTPIAMYHTMALLPRRRRRPTRRWCTSRSRARTSSASCSCWRLHQADASRVGPGGFYTDKTAYYADKGSYYAKTVTNGVGPGSYNRLPHGTYNRRGDSHVLDRHRHRLGERERRVPPELGHPQHVARPHAPHPPTPPPPPRRRRQSAAAGSDRARARARSGGRRRHRAPNAAAPPARRYTQRRESAASRRLRRPARSAGGGRRRRSRSQRAEGRATRRRRARRRRRAAPRRRQTTAAPTRSPRRRRRHPPESRAISCARCPRRRPRTAAPRDDDGGVARRQAASESRVQPRAAQLATVGSFRSSNGRPRDS